MIYTKIKKICAEKGISVAQVEREAGLKNGAISKWNDVTPLVTNLKAVADYLGVSIESLLEE